MNQANQTIKVLENLFRQGVQHFVVCAGSRNACFVEALSAAVKMTSYFHFEERSAAFFALGLSRRMAQPVAVIVTSGTAVANILPALIEAYYGGGQLIVISADRPKTYRGTGAPQAIDQFQIFGSYVDTQYDFSIEEAIDLEIQGNTHINICFEEPVLDADIEKGFDKGWVFSPDIKVKEKSKEVMVPPDMKLFGAPLVIISQLSRFEIEQILPILLEKKMPVFFDACAIPQTLENQLVLGIDEEAAKQLLDSKEVNSVVRVGGVPVCRLWRDFEKKYLNIPIVSFSPLGFGGLARTNTLISGPQFIEKALIFFSELKENNSQYLNSKLMTKGHPQLFTKYPQSEPSFFQKLGRLLNSSDQVFVGNSLPIRNWSKYSKESRVGELISCRGANGIDGLISLCLGYLHPEKTTWCVIGDLTTMYDMAGLWALRFFQKGESFNLIVVNNNGGKIFSHLYSNPAFQCIHDQDFSSLAKFYNMNYIKLTSSEDICRLNGASFNLIEWTIDNVETEEFLQQWQKLK